MHGSSSGPHSAAHASVADAGDARLISQVAGGDRHAFEALYRSYFPRLTRFLNGLTRSVPLIEEIVNDTMLVVWQKAWRFDGSCKLTTWIFAIAYRKACKAIRGLDEPVDVDPDLFEADGTFEPEHGLEQQRLQRAIGAALDDLPAAQRAVVQLTYQHEMGYADIAEIMDCPVNTVKTRMFHARRRLRSLLAGQKKGKYMNRPADHPDQLAHQQAQKLLPWLLAGTLDGAELAQVQSHVQACAQCQADLEWQRNLRAAWAAQPDAEVDADRAFAKLSPRLAPQAQRVGVLARWRTATAANSPWLRWTAVAQFAAIGILSVLLARSGNDAAGYRGLGNAASTQGNVVVVFKPATSEREMRRILHANDARVVDGPTVTDAYILALPAAQANDALTRMRAEPAVTLAQPLSAESRR